MPTTNELPSVPPPPAKAVVPPTPAPTVAAPSAIVYDWDSARAHLAKVEATVIEKWAGQPGMNPHIFVAQRIAPLRLRLAQGTSPELFNDIMSIPLDVEPKVNMLDSKAQLL